MWHAHEYNPYLLPPALVNSQPIPIDLRRQITQDRVSRKMQVQRAETEYFDSARSNAMAPSSTTTAACAPSRKSESIWLSESVVINQDYSPRQPPRQ